MRYERIGRVYAQTRREDRRLAARIHAALGDAGTVVNVGAGTGSYEPRDRYVVAVEPSDAIAGWLGGAVTTEVVEIPRDTPDWTLMSFWAHPERLLDPAARASTSGFARMPEEVVERVVGAVDEDLSTGAWDRRHGHLRDLESFDAGLRLVVATPS
jgi:hypothetical protein